MTIPKSNIWQDIRSACLDAIPHGSRASQKDPNSVGKWREVAYFTVASASNKGFSLISPSVDFGSALLGDAQHFLDHATEHQVTLWRQMHNPKWSSPAWTVVTIYYWSFFLASSLTRLLGNTTIFLRTDDLVRLKQVATVASVTKPLAAGSFRIHCGPRISANDREVYINKDSPRVHDDLWRLWFKICGDYTVRYSKGSGSVLETRIYNCFARSSSILGSDWPSALRNAVNYKPGFAYDTIRKGGRLESLKYIVTMDNSDISVIVDRFEQNLASVKTVEDVVNQPKIACRLLVDLTFLIYAITNELFEELLDRNRIDRRWNDNRIRFLKQEGLIQNSKVWPF